MPEKAIAKKKLTYKQQRDLDVEIGFIEGVVKRDPDYVEALQILGDNYTIRGKFKRGLRIDERLAELRPSDPLVQYNLACSCSLTGLYSKAHDALLKAFDLGYNDFAWISRDPDMAKFRKHKLYQSIRARIREIQAQRK
jgi:tetratricopeptide (TPR) repeat protein